jgi:hypothetical protein
VAGHPHVPAEHVGRHGEPGHVAEVARAVGVRPGDGGEDFAHVAILWVGANRLSLTPVCRALHLLVGYAVLGQIVARRAATGD